MERDSRTGQPKDPSGKDVAGVRTPPEGTSSAETIVPIDTPALIEYPSGPTETPTLIEYTSDSPTIIETGQKSSGSARPGEVGKGSRVSSAFAAGQATLEPGTVLCERYEIVAILGQGGMGAVYKATDVALNRTVALKVIRPELAREKAIVDRFKQELLLAHQVTHRNVIRIYDLSEADGVKFITMEYVEGENLLTLIQEKKKFTPEESVEIMRQVCLALEAAHNVGVIHRDLKPQNIMRDTTGRILVMDFGLARTLEGDGMTQSGALMGTMEYMSPEQALGKHLDQRSDIFAVGLIFYEMLTGLMPFKADSAIASLIRRTQERVAPVSEHDATIPPSVSSIVGKCLERDIESRYKSASELLADLEGWQGKRAAATLKFEPKVGPWARTIPWPSITVGIIVLVLAAIGYSFREKLFQAPTSQATVAPAVSLAILPFRNASGDASFDWLGSSIADMLSTDVGQSSKLRTVSSDRLHQIFSDLRITSTTALDPSVVRRVADFSSADRVVSGQYAKFGEVIRIDATLQDTKSGETVPLKIDIPSEKDIPAAIDKLADSIRQRLALPENVLRELKASSFKITSQSVDALRAYDLGVGFQRDGKSLEAQKQFEAATKADPNFALAFSRLAQIYSSLGYDSEAEQAAQKAVLLSQDLPESEKYLISAIGYQVGKNYPEAIKAYENLAKASPDNSDVESALAGLYKDSGDLARARDYDQKLLTSNPKDVAATMEMGRLQIKTGDPQGSLDPLNRAYTLAVQVNNEEQEAASLHFIAVAYSMLSKPEESVRNEQQALAIWRRIGQKRGMALSLNEMGTVEAALGKSKDALASFQEALQVRRDIGDRRGLGDTLIDLGNFYNDAGDHDQALKMYKEALQLQRDLGNESLQAICLNNIGTVYSEKGQYEDSLTYYQQALDLREKSKVPQDIVEAVHNLGETSAQMGNYDKAVSYYLRALELRRSMDDARGAAIESYSLGTLFDYQGRFGAAIDAKQQALKDFRDIKDHTSWMAKMLNGVAQALILAGRGDEAKGYLDESLNVSRELKADGMTAEGLGFQGDAFFYRGDLKSAHSAYDRALQSAVRSKEPDTILLAKADIARIEVDEKQPRQAVANLKPLIQQADEIGLKYTSVECSILAAEAMMQNGDESRARQDLERDLLLADKLGMQPLSARTHYLLATAKGAANSGDASDNYRETLRLLDSMKKDSGADKLLQRADFKTMYEESTQKTQAAKN